MKNYLMAANMILNTTTLDFEERAEEIEYKTGVPGEFILDCLEDMRFHIMARWEEAGIAAADIIRQLQIQGERL